MMTKAAEKTLNHSLKLIIKKENGKNEAFFNQKANHHIYYSDGHALAIVPESQAVIYSDTYASTGIATCYRDSFLDINFAPGERQFWKGESRVVPFGNKSGTVIILYYNDSEVWINAKLIKDWFGNPEDLQFITTGEKSPIYIYENSVAIGLILPINKQPL